MLLLDTGIRVSELCGLRHDNAHIEEGYLKDMLASKKSVYGQVVYDSSGVERTFAEDLEKAEVLCRNGEQIVTLLTNKTSDY